MSQILAPAPALRIGPLALDVPVALAPMAGITNTAFRRLCREYGAGLYVSEMITSRALVERNDTTMRLIRHHESETPRSIQLYGVDPATVAEAVRIIVAEDHADHIDLNFGCPVPKVTRKGGGSALPWKLGLFRDIVTRAVRAAGSIPLTVKMRKGIDDEHLTYLEAGRAAEDAGVAAVHTRCHSARASALRRLLVSRVPMRRLLVLPCLLLCLASGVARAQHLFIPPGQEAQVQALLAPVAFHQPLPQGWLLTGISIEGATVSLTFTGTQEATARLVLHHPQNGQKGVQVGPLVLEGEAPAPVLEALRASLEAKPASMLPWRPARAMVPRTSELPASTPSFPVPWQRWLPFVLLAACLGWLAVRYRRHLTRWAVIALPVVTIAGLLVRLRFSPRTMLHEYYHAGDHLLGYLFPESGQRFFYGDTGPTLYTLANAVLGGDEQAVFTTNLVLSVLTIPALALFDYVLFRDWKRATFTASLFALLPLNVRFAASEDLSNPAVLLGTLALVLGVVFVQRGGWVAALGAALATSLTMQTRPELMLWPVAVLLVALGASRVGQWSRLVSIPAAVAALVLLLTALPQALHLLSLPGSERLHGGIFQKPGLIAFLDPKAVPPLLVLVAVAGLVWALRRRRWLGLALLLVAAGGAHVSLTFFLNPPPYNLRTQMITLPTLLVLCGCVVPLLREWLAKRPGLATLAPASVLVAVAVWSSTSAAWVREVGDAQQEFDFLVRAVPQLPAGQGALLTVVGGGAEGGARVGMFPMHLLARASSGLVPEALPDPMNPNATWPPDDGLTVFYQGMYCYSSFQDEPPAAPMTPRCARVHERYVLEPIVTEEIAGPGYSPMAYAPPPYLIGFYRAVALRELLPAPSAAVPPSP